MSADFRRPRAIIATCPACRMGAISPAALRGQMDVGLLIARHISNSHPELILNEREQLVRRVSEARN